MYKKIITSDIQVGMILSKDVITRDGILLIAKETELNANHIIKINLYEIDTIEIFTPILPVEQPLQPWQPISQTEEFIKFATSYSEHLQEVENQFSKITKTGEVPQHELLSLVDNLMNATETQSQLFSFMCRLNNLDDVTFNHSLNVSILAHIFGVWLNLKPKELEELTLAGLLHDIGKLKVSSDILNKPAKLTDEEFSHIKRHTVLGYEMIASTDLPDSVKHTILMHHEKMNGAGYPLGLSWNNIHPYAKIISIVDIYDAMTAERPYHKRFHPFHVIKMFEEECYGVLDTQYLYIFLEHIAHNFLHDKVVLSNKDQANIIFINKQSPSRPIVETMHKNIIDLYTNPKIEIEGFI